MSMELNEELKHILSIRRQAQQNRHEYYINLSEQRIVGLPTVEQMTSFLIDSFHFEQVDARGYATEILNKLKKYEERNILTIFIKNLGTTEEPNFEIGIKTP